MHATIFCFFKPLGRPTISFNGVNSAPCTEILDDYTFIDTFNAILRYCWFRIFLSIHKRPGEEITFNIASFCTKLNLHGTAGNTVAPSYDLLLNVIISNSCPSINVSAALLATKKYDQNSNHCLTLKLLHRPTECWLEKFCRQKKRSLHGVSLVRRIPIAGEVYKQLVCCCT